MPTHDVLAAREWRLRHVAPYHRSRPLPAAPQPAPQPMPAPTGTLDELEAFAAAHCILSHDAGVALVNALGDAAAARLATGQPLGELQAPLQRAMRMLPEAARELTAIPLPVYAALCADVVAALEAGFASPADREADRAAFEAGGEAAAAEMGAFWYRVACGEMVLK